MQIRSAFLRFRTGLMRITAVLVGGFLAQGAAQAFPTKPITIVVPFAAGGPSDTIARLFAASMSQKLNGQIIVENVAGAGSTIGIARVAKADPDGHTLLLSHISHATTASLYRKLPYDPVADFAPVGMVTDGAFVLVSRKDFGTTTLPELFARLKAEGDKISYAHAGVGSGSHLCGLMLMGQLGVKMTQVPYRGTGPAMNDLVSGKVDVLCDQITSALPQIQGKVINAYAVTSTEPVKGLDLPTLAASGLPGFRATVWHGLYAPKGTPPAVVAQLNKALKDALKDPVILQRLQALSTDPATEAQADPAFLGRHLVAEIAAWKKIIDAAGVYAD
jgi:tripartite-type tricarboxylate transporter receptor subunit TctC